MPTITIRTTALSTVERRAIAVRLTRWFAEHDSDRRHVVVRFERTEEGTVFVGGLPIEALPHEDEGLHHASVVCCVSVGRDEAFYEELAAVLADSLGMTTGTPFFYLEFRPTPKESVYFGAEGRLRRADATLRGNR
ncbi:hypothetical protein SAMN04489729_0193 [Amycolatopsis lurida]|uniref:Tautomerase n=1 Tax=Amycolatopsis lurida NRRL 2430 TaxID=1460371 RepID=A0A2P2FPT1_AMYLU|nr:MULTISPECIES: hypothetical protein [Amycolatopsis]KFU78734.1 hypothetical protein BB31_23625 [Amycolatopsis lurida NRRL 2430]QXV56398.1 hypothetical protein CVV72_04780 [Amycolatopsis sp. TNS106]SEB32059.1 hypothetical protein SAMN04489729_0193 [Amycolatopsis lurida]